MKETLATIEQARSDGVDVTACLYPYDFWATRLQSLRFAGDWRSRFGIDYQDLQVGGTEGRLSAETFERAKADNKLVAALGSIPGDEVDLAMRTPWTIVGSDAIVEPDSNNHPRAAGTFSRTLGRVCPGTSGARSHGCPGQDDDSARSQNPADAAGDGTQGQTSDRSGCGCHDVRPGHDRRSGNGGGPGDRVGRYQHGDRQRGAGAGAGFARARSVARSGIAQYLTGRRRRGGFDAMVTHSAGIVLWRSEGRRRTRKSSSSIRAVHSGRARNDHAWSIPKGEFDPAVENARGRALVASSPRSWERRCRTAVGLVPLAVVKASGQTHPSVPGAAATSIRPSLVSNTTEIEWPPRSGRRLTIPEVDAAAWIRLADAERSLHKGQAGLAALVRSEVEGARRGDRWVRSARRALGREPFCESRPSRIAAVPRTRRGRDPRTRANR